VKNEPAVSQERTIRAAGPGTFVVEVTSGNPNPHFVSMAVAADGKAGTSFLVPAISRTLYRLDVASGPITLSFDEREVEAVQLRRVSLLDFWRLIHRKKIVRRLQTTIADGVQFMPLLTATGREGRILSRSLRLLTGWGFGLGSANLQETPDLFASHQTVDDMPPRRAAVKTEPPVFAVVIHLFYRELWPQFESYLRRLKLPFHLIVTITDEDKALSDRIGSLFADAEVVVYENRGRDVGPFLQLLHDGRLDGFDFICKLHGKRTKAAGPRSLLGQVWRTANLVDLLGSDEQVQHILNRFRAEPRIGMIGSARFRVPNGSIQLKAPWGENKEETLRLGTRVGIARDDFQLDFFAGTMFWVRGEVLAPLRQLNLTLADFLERTAADGDVPHAIERLFGALPQRVGMRLESVIATRSDQPQSGQSPLPTARVDRNLQALS
jgi:lipopolysaccharide biosynthesis protein